MNYIINYITYFKINFLNLINKDVNINTYTMEEKVKEVKYIDLFCGLGAFHTAFNRNNILKKVIKEKRNIDFRTLE